MPIPDLKNTNSKKIKVLLVEDDAGIVKMYERKFKLGGYDLKTVFNGVQGLAALKKSRFDIVLLDIMMPKMNGLEMLKTVKQDPQYKKLPIVMLTNLGDRAEDIQICKKMGAEDYWVKANIKLDEMLSKINAILAKKDNT